MGFPWRPKVGDWYVDHLGFCELVRSIDDVERIAEDGARAAPAVFIPDWDDCRAWLSERGWGHPEVMVDADSEVTMAITHESGRRLRTTGVSDLDCLYRFILLVQMRSPTLDAVVTSHVSVLEPEPEFDPVTPSPDCRGAAVLPRIR